MLPLFEQLIAFDAATPELLGARDLLQRADSKFVASAESATAAFSTLKSHYQSLPVTTGVIAAYRSLYFDTDDRRCFHDHRRGRRIRYKVRIRHYPDRALSFLEVKIKRNEKVTDKKRVAISFGQEHLGSEQYAFLRQYIPWPIDGLAPILYVDCQRTILLGIAANERVTIDVDIRSVHIDGETTDFGKLVVIEVKQSQFCARTPVMRALAAARIRQQAMSKYAIAYAMLHPTERRNRLLADLREIAALR